MAKIFDFLQWGYTLQILVFEGLFYLKSQFKTKSTIQKKKI